MAGPLYELLGNPYLAYNLTLLLFWAASGWAMYAVTYGVTRCHPAAAAAMLVFTLAPPRIQYAVEFQMEIMFGLPLAVYALVRYLETQRARYLVAFLVAFWLQAIAVWYFAVILGSGLVVLALSYALRHWSGWRGRTMLASAAGIVALGAALAPVAWPFFVTRAELGLQRGIRGRGGTLGGRSQLRDDGRGLAGAARADQSWPRDLALSRARRVRAGRPGDDVGPAAPAGRSRRAGGPSA